MIVGRLTASPLPAFLATYFRQFPQDFEVSIVYRLRLTCLPIASNMGVDRVFFRLELGMSRDASISFRRGLNDPGQSKDAPRVANRGARLAVATATAGI